jgi:hypothetical protein
MSSDPIRKLKAQAAQEARQRETERQRHELLVQVDREHDRVRFFSERTETEQDGSNRDWAEQIARFLAAVRAAGLGSRFEALQPNDNAAWTVALDVYRHCWEGDIDGATAKLDEAEAIGPSWARASITGALKRTIPDAIVSPPSPLGNAGEAAQAEGASDGTGQAEVEQAEGAGQRPRKRRGRPAAIDPKADQRIYEAWKTRHYKTYDELAVASRQSKRAVQLAIERHRKRIERAGQ